MDSNKIQSDDDLRHKPVSNVELEWVAANFAELQAKYSGEWIAVMGETLIAHAVELDDVIQSTRQQGIDDPFIDWIAPFSDETYPLILVMCE